MNLKYVEGSGHCITGTNTNFIYIEKGKSQSFSLFGQGKGEDFSEPHENINVRNQPQRIPELTLQIKQ